MDHERAEGQVGAAPRLATQRAARLATAGLGAVLLFLGVFPLWSAIRSERSGAKLERSQQLSQAYSALRKAIDDERLVEHEDALGHSGNFDAARSRRLAKRFDAATDDVRSSLAEVRRFGGPQDRQLAVAAAALQRR